MLAYFGLTLFVSATLLFLVQPMIGKMILPQLGGTPAVWNTCMVFFQGVLLFGYGYTHQLTTTMTTRRQLIIQGVLLFLPFIVLPFSLGDWVPKTEVNPIFSVFYILLLMVGLPFLVVSTTAPLMQKWFQHTGHPAAKDPYFLYGASNFGSMLGLALYPTIVEPLLPVTPTHEGSYLSQVHLWAAGYALFVALVVGSAALVWQALGKAPSAPEAPPPPPMPTSTPATAIIAAPRRRGARLEPAIPTPSAPASVALPTANDTITLWRRLRWIGLAAAPSSLMLGVTTYMTTDIAAVAFFWIVPLMLYLLTFILVFARWPVVWVGTPHTVILFVQPCAILLLVLKMTTSHTFPWYDTGITFALHLIAFFATALMCHGELAKDRPSAKHLTEFFFWMSLGGVLGGIFNALFAPVVFQNGIWEYPIAMAFACLLRSNLVDQPQTVIPGDSTAERATPLGYALDYAVPIAIIFLGYYFAYLGLRYDHNPDGTFFLFQRKYLLAGLVVGVLALSLRPVRFGLAVAAVFLGVSVFDQVHDELLYEGRSFFGLLRVRESEGTSYRMPTMEEDPHPPREWKVYRTLIHGGINHGRQITDFKREDNVENPTLTMIKRREPITYFYDRNGVAEVYNTLIWPKPHVPTAKWPAMIVGNGDVRMPTSMVGLAFGANPAFSMLANTQSEPPFAVVGLGTGLLACYAKPYQHVDFYEIDPLVKNLSITPGYMPPWHPDRDKRPKLKDPTFYFVHDAQERWAKIDVILGDGRLKIKDAPKHYYHVITLDAFSSDAIPVHLLTAEAVELYMDKLVEGGVLLFNTTNRFVRIEGVLAGIAKEKGYDCLYCPDFTHAEDHPDRYSADWVVLQRRVNKETYKNGSLPITERLQSQRVRLWWNGVPVRTESGKERIEQRWQAVDPLAPPVFTDAHSNLLRIMRW